MTAIVTVNVMIQICHMNFEALTEYTTYQDGLS